MLLALGVPWSDAGLAEPFDWLRERLVILSRKLRTSQASNPATATATGKPMTPCTAKPTRPTIAAAVHNASQ